MQLVALLGVGFLLRRLGRWGDTFFSSLSRFVVRIALPLYLFIRISRSDPDAILRSPLFLIAAVLLIGTGLLFSWLIFSFLPFKGDEKRAGIALGAFGNSGYIPLSIIDIFPITLPMISEVFGIATPSLYVGTYLLIFSPALWSLGNYLMTGRGKRPGIKEIFTPPFIAVFAGFLMLTTGLQGILDNEGLPFFHIMKALDRIGDMTLPMVLISLGAMIGNLHTSKYHRSKLFLMAAASSVVRFLLLPGLFYASYFLFLRHMNLTPGQIWVLFLETHIPPATNLSVMARHEGIHEDYAATTLMVAYGLYLLLFPFYLMIFLKLPGVLPGG
jgi:predicted permease